MSGVDGVGVGWWRWGHCQVAEVLERGAGQAVVGEADGARRSSGRGRSGVALGHAMVGAAAAQAEQAPLCIRRASKGALADLGEVEWTVRQVLVGLAAGETVQGSVRVRKSAVSAVRLVIVATGE